MLNAERRTVYTKEFYSAKVVWLADAFKPFFDNKSMLAIILKLLVCTFYFVFSKKWLFTET